jgi:tetratricopeptide (TPR) repeat protein
MSSNKANFDTGPTSHAPFWSSTALRAAFLLVATLLVYWPSYRAGFIWDDDAMITANPLVKAGWDGLRDIWFSTKFHDYVPLTLTSFWLEWRLWGMEKTGYHVVNVLLHALNVILLWRVLLRLRVPGAWLAAMIFAVHPVCVASVTWVAERKNTLSMLFYLLSLLFYLRSDSGHQPSPGSSASGLTDCQPTPGPHPPGPVRATGATDFRSYCCSLVTFCLGLLSKTSIVVLPAVLLLCVWWQRGRISRQDLGRTVPFLLAAFICGLMTLGIHHYRAPAEGLTPITDSLLVRALGGTRAVWFYLGKVLLPLNLTMHYPRWVMDPASPLGYLPGLILLGSFALFWCFRRSWGRACLFGFGYFVIALSPTLGLLKMVFLSLSQVADHFQYLALPGLIALFVGGLYRSVQPATGKGLDLRSITAEGGQHIPPALYHPDSDIVRPVSEKFAFLFLRLVATALITLLSALTWQYERIVGSPEALWHDNIKKNLGSWPAHNNLARILAEQGRYKEAEQQCFAALAIDPGSPDVWYNLGNAFLAQHKLDEAIRAFSEAIRLAPADSKAHNNLSNALFQKNRTNEALHEVRKAVRLDPDNVEARSNFGHMLSERAKSQEAISQYREILRLQPANAAAHNNLGHLLAAGGHLDEALPHFVEAVRLQPGSPEAQANLGNLLLQKGQLGESLRHYSEAVRLQPEDVIAQTGLGNVLAKLGKADEASPHYTLAHFLFARQLSKQGKVEEAMQHYLQALELRPDFGEAHYELGLMLLQQHKTAEALDHWRQALKSQPNSSELLNNLAWLLATSPDDKVRNGAEAVPLAERACGFFKTAPLSYLDTLAAAYAETDRFDDAVSTAQKAVTLAEQAGAKEKAEWLRQRLALYQTRHPYREGS